MPRRSSSGGGRSPGGGFGGRSIRGSSSFSSSRSPNYSNRSSNYSGRSAYTNTSTGPRTSTLQSGRPSTSGMSLGSALATGAAIGGGSALGHHLVGSMLRGHCRAMTGYQSEEVSQVPSGEVSQQESNNYNNLNEQLKTNPCIEFNNKFVECLNNIKMIYQNVKQFLMIC